jgi:1,4-dihydroxy-2-naphthoyl-CoA hydrolase
VVPRPGREQVATGQVTSRRMGEQVTTAASTAPSVGPAGVLGERMGITITEASPERVVGTMPVAGNTQPYGLLHGGASCVLAESLGSVAATLHAQEAFGGYALGLEISATHHRSAKEGLVTGVATPLHRGGSVATYEIVITDESGARVCTVRLTCVLRRP